MMCGFLWKFVAVFFLTVLLSESSVADHRDQPNIVIQQQQPGRQNLNQKPNIVVVQQPIRQNNNNNRKPNVVVVQQPIRPNNNFNQKSTVVVVQPQQPHH